MIEHSEQITKLIEGLRSVQAELNGVKKDSQNPHFRNKYASLEAVIDAVKHPLLGAGFAFTQAPGRVIDGAVEITTMLMHDSGEWMRSTLHVPLAKTDPQGVGSAITYGCRYALMATLGLPPIDDDAEAAVGRGPQQAQPSRPTVVPKANDAAAYVDHAIDELRALETEKALSNWWRNEKANRDKHGLDPTKGPGLKLMEAYGDRKSEIQSTLMMAG